VFINASGGVVFASGFDPQQGKRVALPRGLQTYLGPDSALVRHSSTRAPNGGLILLPQGPMMVASRPDPTSQKRGPIAGTLIFGRWLNTVEIDRLSQLTYSDISFQVLNVAQIAPEWQNARAALQSETVAVQPLNDRVVAGYSLLMTCAENLRSSCEYSYRARFIARGI
jgi:sensor domain CHASE-containing protein